MTKYLLKRATAYLIDCTIAFSIVMIIIQWGILSHTREWIGITDDWFKDSLNMQLYVSLSISLPVWIYFSYFDSILSKGTIGKRLLGLHLSDINNNSISFPKAFLRTVLKLLPWEIAHVGVIFPTPLYYEQNGDVRLLSYVGISLFVIYVISVIINVKNQSLYDIVLNTCVSQQNN